MRQTCNGNKYSKDSDESCENYTTATTTHDVLKKKMVYLNLTQNKHNFFGLILFGEYKVLNYFANGRNMRTASVAIPNLYPKK